MQGGNSHGRPNDRAMLPIRVTRPGSLVFYIRLNMVDHSLHSQPGNPKHQQSTRESRDPKTGHSAEMTAIYFIFSFNAGKKTNSNLIKGSNKVQKVLKKK